MSKMIELSFSGEHETVVRAELFENEAPISVENLWIAIGEGYRARLHHGRHCAAELWCYLPEPSEPIPYENSTVFPDTGDLLYYHFIQPPTRQGRWVFDLGIFYSQGQSRLPSGWLPGNRIGRILGGDRAIRSLELVAAQLLQGRPIELVLRRHSEASPSEETLESRRAALDEWFRRLNEPPEDSTEADVTRVVAGAEGFAQELVEWIERDRSGMDEADRRELRAGASRLAEAAARWRFATDRPVPPDWNGSAVSYWRNDAFAPDTLY